MCFHKSCSDCQTFMFLFIWRDSDSLQLPGLGPSLTYVSGREGSSRRFSDDYPPSVRVPEGGWN